MIDPVQCEEAALRRAVRSGDFAGVESASGRYAAALQTALLQLPRTQAPHLLGKACELIDWARRCLCVARVRLGAERSGARRLAAFQRTVQPDRLHTWRIDG